MLVRFMPELGKYAMDSSTVTLLFLLVFVSMVTKDILEAKKLLKRYEALQSVKKEIMRAKLTISWKLWMSSS